DRKARKKDRRLREAPAGDDRGDGERRAVSRRLVAPAPDERERADARDERDGERRERASGDEPLEQTVGVEAERGESAHRERTGCETRGECAPPEVVLQLRTAAPDRVGGEKD